MKKKKGFKIAYVFEFVAFAGIVFSAAIFALMFLLVERGDFHNAAGRRG